MRLSPWTSLLLATSVFSFGCNDKVAPGDDGSASASASGTSASESDDGMNWEPGPARGDIALTSVVVNQGVEVPVAVDGVWVGPTERNSYLVADRDALVRAFWEIPEDWVARDITARLRLIYPDGTDVTYEETKTIDGPAYPGDYGRAFNWPLLAEQFPPDLQFHVSLWEASLAGDDQRESTTILEGPIGGPQLIGVQPQPAEMRVIMVPVVYDNGSGCQTDTSTITAEEEQTFVDFLHEEKPVKEIIWEFRRDTPIMWNDNLNSLSELWEPLLDLRAADQAPPNAFYYALVDVCGPGIDGAAGIAPGTPPPTKEAAYQRVSSGVWLGGAKYAYEVIVHELGHNQGRSHTFCEGGGAAGTDPSYPHDNGLLGSWGFGIRFFQFHSPTATFDYMSYCQPVFASDWTWSKTYDQIRELTSWDYEAPPANPEPEREVLIGLLLKNGEERWWTAKGGREAEYFSGAQSVTLDYGDEQMNLPAAVEELVDGNKMVTIQLPRPGVTFTSATRIDSNGGAHPIAVPGTTVKAWSY
jgi:hypothetical protein